MTAQKQVKESRGGAMTLSLTDLGSVGILRVLETVTKQGTINARAQLPRQGDISSLFMLRLS